MPWIYSQRGGMRRPDGTMFDAQAYSGAAGAHKNNPDSQHIRRQGPIPRGRWRMTKMQASHPKLGPLVIHLEPEPGTEVFGRDHFRVHGDSQERPGDASTGCIIIHGGARRQQMWDSGDRIIEVTE